VISEITLFIYQSSLSVWEKTGIDTNNTKTTRRILFSKKITERIKAPKNQNLICKKTLNQDAVTLKNLIQQFLGFE